MADGNWSVAEAKAEFSERVEKAETESLQRVPSKGKDAVVIVSAAEWRLPTRPVRSLTEVLTSPP